MNSSRALVVLGVLLAVTLLASACDGDDTSQGSASTSGRQVTVDVGITSDPAGAIVTVDRVQWGSTPLTIQAIPGRAVPYQVVAVEPYADYMLYKPFSGTLEVLEDTSISVWIERTTADEQEAQRNAAARAAAEREAARVEAERQACLRRIGNAKIIIESWRWQHSYDYAIVEGEVRNNTNGTLRNIAAVATFRTSNGTFITADDSLIEYQDLLPGQRSPFKVYARWNPQMSTASIEFREFLGGPVTSMTRATANECR